MDTAEHAAARWSLTPETSRELGDHWLVTLHTDLVEDVRIIASVPGTLFDADGQMQPTPHARLIATAPDLVANHEYLDSVMPCDDQDFDPGDLVEIAITAQAMWAIRAALAKARPATAGSLAGTWPGTPDDGFEALIDDHRHGDRASRATREAITAFKNLVACDNNNYTRARMRRDGFFEMGREALAALADAKKGE